MTYENSALFRILDANLDRAREGLRVIEEWCRFGLEARTLASQCKDLRHQLSELHCQQYRQARNTPQDVGTQLDHPKEFDRDTVASVVAANFARVQEALRVLEEYGKLTSGELAQASKYCRYKVYALESAMDNRERFQQLITARLYLVTSPHPNLLSTIELALKGGLKLVQYREKDLPDCDRLNQAIQVRKLCHQYRALFIVNDRVDIAIASEADGVHLGQQDLPMESARLMLGEQKLVGRSTTSPTELERAITEKADYIGVGPVFETPTKLGKKAVGFKYIQHAAEYAPMPWYAIGGINAENISSVIQAGAQRIALVRAIMESANPTQTTQSLRRTLGE